MTQLVGFKWKKNDGNWQPLFLFSTNDGEEPERFTLWNNRINFKLGSKRCVGYFSGGRHYKCPDSADSGLASTCSECKKRDDWFGCIQCAGFDTSSLEVNSTPPAQNNICDNPKQRVGCMKNRYWIYLAAFDGQLKVGISYEQRFFERMIEQGADFGCRLGIVQDGGYARALEQRIARYLGLPDRIHGVAKQAKLFGEPNRSIVEIAKTIAKRHLVPNHFI